MKETINRMDQLLIAGKNYLSNCTEKELTDKISHEKWSKKEISGHLIDSALNKMPYQN